MMERISPVEAEAPYHRARGTLRLRSNGDFTTNGGVIVDYAFDPSQFTMSNGSDEVVVSSLGVEVDRVAYDGGVTFPDQAGYAMNLENFLFDDVSNDFGDNWCLASSSYGGLNFGTPGADNDDCPVCGNDIVEPGEECDDGNVTPFDGCEQDCTDRIRCMRERNH